MSPVRITGAWCSRCKKRPASPASNWCVQCLATERPPRPRERVLASETTEFEAELRDWLRDA